MGAETSNRMFGREHPPPPLPTLALGRGTGQISRLQCYTFGYQPARDSGMTQWETRPRPIYEPDKRRATSMHVK